MTSPPLSVEELAPALAPLGAARMLPPTAYVSPAVLAWEQRHLFAATWSCLGRTAELVAAGRQQAALCGDVGVLLTVVDGALHAYANTCRHRGHELLPTGTSDDAAVVRCPYHAWVYGLDGRLRGAPGYRDVPDFRREDHGLAELPIADWHGWTFVNATADAPPLSEYLGALTELVAPYGPERLQLGARHGYDVAANWKVLCENYHECYHCPQIHPELCRVSPPASGDNYRRPGAWVGGNMLLRAETMSLDGTSGGRPIDGAPSGRVEYLGVIPDLLLSLHPDYVMAHRLVPRAPDRTWIECSWYVPEGVDPAYAVEFWDLVNRQDWAACESVQRGLASPHARPGPFAPNEDAVHDFTSRIAAAYLGRPVHRREQGAG